MSEDRLAPYPGPWGALTLSFGSWFATAALLVMMADPDQKDFGIANLGIAQAIGIGIVATLGARLVPSPQPERLGLVGFAPVHLAFIAMLLPMSLLVSELTNWVHVLLPPPDLQEVTERVVKRLEVTSPLAAVETALVVIGIAPVVEEWLYRGVIQQGLVGHMGRARGVLMTAALFGLAHMEPSLSAASSLASFGATLPVGIMLGAVRLATGSLLAAILLHMGCNAVSLGGMALAAQLPIPGFNAPGAHIPLWIVAPALVVVCIGARFILRDASRALVMIPIPPPEPEAEEDEDGGWF